MELEHAWEAALPRPIDTLEELRRIQLGIAALATPPVLVADVPLAQIAGRVLAEPLVVPPSVSRQDAALRGLPAGIVLDATHIPLLAAGRRVTVPVFQQPRVGLVTVIGDAHAASTDAAQTLGHGTMLAAALQRMGAQPFETYCRDCHPGQFARTVKMYAAECPLVIVIGSPRTGSAARGAEMRELNLAPFGTLQHWRSGDALVVALSPATAHVLVTFAAFIAPLVRRLEGRVHVLSAALAGRMSTPFDTASERVLWVREQPSDSSTPMGLSACSDPSDPAAIAGASGLAWRPRRMRMEDDCWVYLPFGCWLQ